MDEQKKPGQPKPEKKLSRTTLTFYIVGLFSVAIALILISYVAQTRADRQLDTLTDQLNEQQTVAQGATQKMEDLQKQYDAISGADCAGLRAGRDRCSRGGGAAHGGARGVCAAGAYQCTAAGK